MSASKKSLPPTADTPVEDLAGVGPARAKAMRELGLTRLRDLLEYFPRRYQIEHTEGAIDTVRPDQIHTVRGTVVAVNYTSHPRPRFDATIEDNTDKLALVWFNGAYLRTRIHPGEILRVRGKVKFFRGIPQMSNPKWELADEVVDNADTQSALRPVYDATADLPSETLVKVIDTHLDLVTSTVAEWFDPALLKKRQLISRRRAYELIHRPQSFGDVALARRRLVYDELVLLQLGLQISRRLREGRITAPVLRVDKLLDERIRKRFAFNMTNGQTRAVYDIVKDIQSGRPMNRLLQGDVGSGKTVVAVYAMLAAVANKMQAAILAPTEVLAEQHYLTFSKLLEGSSVRIELFTQRTRRQTKGKLLRELEDGAIHLGIGTQALLQEGVNFANLGLIVIDEQHRFGVQQRADLRGKGYLPHTLIMTATPIPRTLALSYFADFDVSTIDELPPGRQEITTRRLRYEQVARAYDFLRQQIAKGRQAYIVVPMVEAGVVEEVKSVKTEFERLAAGPLKGLRLAMLHGQMSTDEKRETMAAFRAGTFDVLVATTVIEVGVDVANATMMLIDNAERFGLSQLHQLRGRVGRGEHPSYCLLISDAQTEDAEARLNAMTTTSNGFDLAELDLQQRGPGEFFGTRQHGLPELKLADLSKELELLQLAREDAKAILDADPRLAADSHRELKAALETQFGDSVKLAAVG